MREERRFRDEPAVRHHHGRGAERRVEVAGQVRGPRGGDEHAAGRRQRDVPVSDGQRFRAGRQSPERGQHRLRHRGQNAGRRPIDPVETAPGALLREPWNGDPIVGIATVDLGIFTEQRVGEIDSLLLHGCLDAQLKVSKKKN